MLPCSWLLLAGLKLSPTTGNLCSVLTTPLPSDFWPTNPKIVTTTSSSGKMAVNPYQASATHQQVGVVVAEFLHHRIRNARPGPGAATRPALQ